MIDNMILNINETDGTTYNQEGVKIRIPGFGETGTVEWLDPYHPFGESSLGYYVDLVDRLVSMGYLRNVSVRGAPYDFRKAPNELTDYMKHLCNLIEETYQINNNTKVVIISHSLGGNVALYFLQNQPQIWKDKFVSAFISVSAPYGGCVKVLRLITSGDPLGYPKILVDPSHYRSIQRSLVSVIWSMPHKEYWKDDEPLIISPFRNYTANDYDELFRDINFEKGIMLRRNTENLMNASIAPGVRSFCLISLNKEVTPATYVYESNKPNWYDDQPSIIYGAGDDTVNRRSLEVCKFWPNTTVNQFSDANHRDTVSDARIIDSIVNILRNIT